MKPSLFALQRGHRAPPFAVFIIFLFGGFIVDGAAFGAIAVTGDVSPLYPAEAPDPWYFDTHLLVGDSADGVLVVDAGSDVASMGSIVGSDPDSPGLISVTGDGSTWTDGGNLYLGVFGIGTVEVMDGGIVDTCARHWDTAQDRRLPSLMVLIHGGPMQISSS